MFWQDEIVRECEKVHVGTSVINLVRLHSQFCLPLFTHKNQLSMKFYPWVVPSWQQQLKHPLGHKVWTVVMSMTRGSHNHPSYYISKPCSHTHTKSVPPQTHTLHARSILPQVSSFFTTIHAISRYIVSRYL